MKQKKNIKTFLLFFDVFLLFMIGFRTIISIMFQFLTVVTFDFFFKIVLLMSISHHIQARNRWPCGSLSDMIFFFYFESDLDFHFHFYHTKMFYAVRRNFESSSALLRTCRPDWLFFFDWFDLSGFIAQDIKVSEDYVVHQLNVNLLI